MFGIHVQLHYNFTFLLFQYASLNDVRKIKVQRRHWGTVMCIHQVKGSVVTDTEWVIQWPQENCFRELQFQVTWLGYSVWSLTNNRSDVFARYMATLGDLTSVGSWLHYQTFYFQTVFWLQWQFLSVPLRSLLRKTLQRNSSKSR